MSTAKSLDILLVEDNEDHAELMLDALGDFNENNRVRHVLDGEQAMAYLRNQAPFNDPDENPRPDLIFLDLRMPRLNGLETLACIKNDDALHAIPVVIVTTSSTKAEIEQSYELGAAGYVTKPLTYESYMEKINQLGQYWMRTTELPEKSG